jgi:hypothetical protein
MRAGSPTRQSTVTRTTTIRTSTQNISNQFLDQRAYGDLQIAYK